MNFLAIYLVLFVVDVHPGFMRHARQRDEVYAIAADVASTDATPAEALRLMQIAAMESSFTRAARGRAHEVGPWQIMPPAASYGAKEALWRMRHQGMLAYVGCRRAGDVVTLPEGTKTTCAEMIEHRIQPADAYLAEHRPPPEAP